MRIVMVSLNEKWTHIADKMGYNTYLGKVQDYIPQKDTTNMYYVSPSNCLNFMDGGIDKVYSEIMFPGICKRIREKIIKLGFKSKLGRPYLPIGKAICTPTNEFTPNNKDSFIISSPTMLLPQDVSQTLNAYYCTLSVIQLLKTMKAELKDTDELIITSFCCGYGNMSPEQSMDQINSAFNSETPEKIILDQQKILLSQPHFYENTEWISFPITTILNH